ncbi:MAG: aldo/keto reductase [Candidatus Dojkabacteria bacterium]
MNYRTLGKTNLKISELGFGTWQLANDPGSWVGSDPKESLECLEKFVDEGGNFIDTAWIYGYDDQAPDRHPSEELVGKFLKKTNKENIVVATKIAPLNMKWPAWKGSTIQEVFPKDHIIKSVEDSLRSLGVDQIDLMQFHVWQDNWADENEWKDAIQEIMKNGKVKNFGISINDYQPSNCLKTLDTGLISTIQFIFNIFHQKPTERLLPYAKANNIGLIARVPLDEGGLSGKNTLETTFPEGDLRQNYFGGERLAELVRRTDDLKKLLGKDVNLLPEMALRYILSFDEISTVIPGMRRLYQVDGNIKAADAGKLSDEIMEELKKHTWERNFYHEQDPGIKENGYIEI